MPNATQTRTHYDIQSEVSAAKVAAEGERTVTQLTGELGIRDSTLRRRAEVTDALTSASARREVNGCRRPGLAPERPRTWVTLRSGAGQPESSHAGRSAGPATAATRRPAGSSLRRCEG